MPHGYTGKVLRVDLSAGRQESRNRPITAGTENYKIISSITCSKAAGRLITWKG